MWRFLINLEMGSYDRDHTSEAFVKVSSRSNIRNPVKTPPFLQVSPWSLGGCGVSWWTWRWCHMIRIILQKLLCKFHPDPTSQTLSRLYLSSKFLPGVLEDVEVPDENGDIGIIIQKLLWKFNQDPTSGTLSRLYLSSKSLPGVLEDMEVPDGPRDGVRWMGEFLWSLCEIFIKIQHHKQCHIQNMHDSSKECDRQTNWLTNELTHRHPQLFK